MPKYLLAIDQGTTSSRAIIFDEKAQPMAMHQIPLQQFYPELGWVEQNPDDIKINTIECCRQVLQKQKLSAKDISAIGITNQRETTIIWDKNTGKPLYPAIVWQDRRTADICIRFQNHAINKQLQSKTGLRLDPYFSATKIVWLLENIPGARQRAEQGELAFGTVDTFLLWHLTDGKTHATDATNASRTLLFNIHTQQWDKEILEAFNIPAKLLPTVLDSADNFGFTAQEIFGETISINALIGDQQAATVGQACFSPGMIKATYGTGCFMMLNTGSTAVLSKNNLLTTIAYRLEGNPTYALEGSIFSAGITIKWLRDVLKIISSAHEADQIAESLKSNEGVYFVPAFTGLGAPYWDPHAKGSIMGLTLQSNRHHIVRAAMESVCYQTRDLLESMKADDPVQLETLRVDGGMAVSNWLLQFLANILNVNVQRPLNVETTALGAAFLAGLQSGVYSSLEDISTLWQADATFCPSLENSTRDTLYEEWKHAVARVVTH